MTKLLITKNILFGFASWLVPFAVSFAFYKPNGELLVPYSTFKSTIMVVGTLTGCYLLFRYFQVVDNSFVRNGVIVGLSWFIINILLDTLVLIPMMKSTFSDYFKSIGLSYLAIPIISMTIGYSLERKRR